jgi:hypothetical protein
MSDRPVWTYWVTRDSGYGQLSHLCRLWCRKPTRVRRPHGVTWVDTAPSDPGKIGIYTIAEVSRWFRVYPETDLELIKAEQHPTDRELADLEKQRG